MYVNNQQSVYARYGRCSHLVRDDVCSFLLSKRPFTTELFVTYGEASGSTRRQGSTDAAQDWTRPQSLIQESKQGPTFSEKHRLHWAGLLAVSSDLQLIPRLIGVDALKEAVEQLSIAPHRVDRENAQGALFSGSNSNQNAATRRFTAGMSYPQFVELLSLLAIAAAAGLRGLYPHVAGPEPSVDARSRDSDASRGSPSDKTTSCGGPLKLEEEPVPPGHGLDSEGERNETSNTAENRIPRKHEMRPKKGRSALAPPAAPAIPTRDAQTEGDLPCYDLGGLKALFHHAEAAHEEKHAGSPRSQGCSSADLSRSSLGPARRNETREEACPSVPLNQSTRRMRLSSCVKGGEPSDDGNGGRSTLDRGESGTLLSLDCEGAAAAATAAVSCAKSLPQKELFPVKSAQVWGEICRRVLELEAEILPHRPDDGETLTAADGKGSQTFFCRDDQGGVEGQPGPELILAGAGGEFARLVVIKELQPVPEHAPEDARHLLELVLDHQQAGRYTLALETLEKGVAMWEELQGAGHSDEEPADAACALDASDEALVLILKASVYQSAGKDDDALSTLLRAEEAVTSIHRGDWHLQETLQASVLSEMGVTLYYSGRTALSLRFFRLALVVRHNKLFRSTKHHEPDTETAELANGVYDGWKRAQSYGMQDSDTLAAEAGETAAAITLNNLAVCLAETGESASAAQALAISSTITTSALGIEHPRSAVVSRNLALVKANKGRGRCSTRDGGQKKLQRWEKEMWRALDTRQWTPHHADEANSVAQRTSHVIPGGFFFAGKLPPAASGNKSSGSNGRRKKKGVKKRGQSARR